MSTSNEKTASTATDNSDTLKGAHNRPLLAMGAFAIGFGPVLVGLVFGWWLAEIMKFFLGTGLFQFLVVTIFLTLFTCWIYKKGFDAGKKWG